MNCHRLKIAFAGTPAFAAVSLQALLASEHELVGVLTQPDRPAGRGRKVKASEVKQLALEADVAIDQPESFQDTRALDAVRSWGADVLVVAAYGLILPKALLEMAPLGSLNIHASLLPRWRGAAPIHRAVLAGDRQTGVCIMKMDEGLDTGDILLRSTCEISPSETSGQLHDRLAEIGATTLLKALPLYCQGSLQPEPQSDSGVTYAHKLSKQDASLDFTDPATDLDRQIRAMNPWPVAYAMLCGERVRIWQCHLPKSLAESTARQAPGTIIAIGEQSLRVETGHGEIELRSLQWPGGKAQDAGVFAQGRQLLGEKFTRMAA
ncbi:MAG: methionyl-tRNA formyltransferase [Granulosicoccus sp.]|nr:methionyl-tRNA formyltransferase [Granulosicoccus sp.]